jgi:hypothetical protein
MNERILELAKQADLIQWDTLPSGARTPDHESVVKAKRFAELIIKECAATMRESLYDNPSDDWEYGYNEGVYSSVDWIQEKFGVEYCPKCNEEWSGTSCGIPNCGWIVGEEV